MRIFVFLLRLFPLPLHLPVFPHNPPEGNDDKNGVKESEDDGVEAGGYCSTDTETSPTALGTLEIGDKNDDRHPPAGEAPPCTENFISHFVG